MPAASVGHTVRPASNYKRGSPVDTFDMYTAEKLVAGKQAELRAEAEQTALCAVLARQSLATELLLPIRALQTAGRLVRRSANIAWNSTVKGTAAFDKANR